MSCTTTLTPAPTQIFGALRSVKLILFQGFSLVPLASSFIHSSVLFDSLTSHRIQCILVAVCHLDIFIFWRFNCNSSIQCVVLHSIFTIFSCFVFILFHLQCDLYFTGGTLCCRRLPNVH